MLKIISFSNLVILERWSLLDLVENNTLCFVLMLLDVRLLLVHQSWFELGRNNQNAVLIDFDDFPKE